QSHGIVVIGLLQFDRVHSCDGRAEVSSMVVAQANKGQIWQPAFCVVSVEFPLPFREAVIVREGLVEPAEINIRVGSQNRAGRDRYLGGGRERIWKLRSGIRSVRLWQVVERFVNKEPIVADGQSGPERSIPKESGTLLPLGAVRRSGIRRARQHIRIVGSKWIGRE